jgi:hypothetical protein
MSFRFSSRPDGARCHRSLQDRGTAFSHCQERSVVFTSGRTHARCRITKQIKRLQEDVMKTNKKTDGPHDG